MTETLKKILEDLGFTPKEAEVYIYLYRNPESRLAQIQKDLKIDRSTLTKVLQRMIGKGYITAIQNEHNLTLYEAVDPKILYAEWKAKEEKIKELLDKIQALKPLPQEEFKIRFNKGRDAIKKVLDEIIFDEKPYMILGGEIGCVLFEKENIRFVHLANKLKLKARVLTAKASELFVGKYEETRFIPYRSSYSIYIWNNKVAYIFWHEPYFSLVIHNKTLYENHKNLFDLLWNQATIPKKEEVKIIDS